MMLTIIQNLNHSYLLCISFFQIIWQGLSKELKETFCWWKEAKTFMLRQMVTVSISLYSEKEIHICVIYWIALEFLRDILISVYYSLSLDPRKCRSRHIMGLGAASAQRASAQRLDQWSVSIYISLDLAVNDTSIKMLPLRNSRFPVYEQNIYSNCMLYRSGIY